MHSWKESEDTTGCGSAIAAIYPHQREQPCYQINESPAQGNKEDVSLLSQLLAKAHCTQQSCKRQQDVETAAIEKRISIFRDLGFILIKLVPRIKFGWEEGGEEAWKGNWKLKRERGGIGTQ